MDKLAENNLDLRFLKQLEPVMRVNMLRIQNKMTVKIWA